MAALREFIGIAIGAILVEAALGANYAVGGSSGWSLGTDFSTWASSQSLKVGDSLTFSYDSQHTVAEVKKANYDSCSPSNPIKIYTDGNTNIKLSSPGKRYFICGNAGHCTGGMKVEIDTVAAAVATPPPASTPPPVATPPPVSTPPPASPVKPPTPSATPPSKTPSIPPSKSPAMAHPISDAPSMTPNGTPATAPSSDLPKTTPTSQRSAANKLGAGLATGIMMIMLL